MLRAQRLVLFTVCFLAALTPWASVRAGAIDARFYTSYSFDATSQDVGYLTCGASLVDSGCYGGGTLGPFGRVGCMIEGNPSTVGNVVSRAIYVVDVGGGAGGRDVTLLRYVKTDTIDPTTGRDTVGVTLTKTIALPLVGKSNASCLVAGTSSFLYIGTDQTSSVARVEKGPLSVTEIIAGSTAYKLKYIDADQYGYVSVVSVEPGNSDATFQTVFEPNGLEITSGGGDAYLLTPYAGISNASGSP